MEFGDSVRGRGGELRPLREKLSRCVKEGGKWLGDMLGRDEDGDGSPKISYNLRTFVAGALRYIDDGCAEDKEEMFWDAVGGGVEGLALPLSNGLWLRLVGRLGLELERGRRC